MKYVILPFLFLCSFSFTQRNINWSQKIELSTFYNLYQVDSFIYRSEQPNNEKMKSLHAIGIDQILNIRNARNDFRESKGLQLTLHRIPINTWTFNMEELTMCLQKIHASKKPILIHCKHGSDRTGCLIAAYRIVFQNWSKADAIQEFIQGGYGFHEKYFKHLIRLIENIDVEKMKKEILEN